MDDLGAPLFEETSIWGYGYFMMIWWVFRVIEWGWIVFFGQHKKPFPHLEDHPTNRTLW